MMTETIRNLFMCIRALEAKKLPMKWDGDERLCRIFNEEIGTVDYVSGPFSKAAPSVPGDTDPERRAQRGSQKLSADRESSPSRILLYTYCTER